MMYDFVQAAQDVFQASEGAYSLTQQKAIIQVALENAYRAGVASASDALSKAELRAQQAEGDLKDFKRIWDVENIGERLETYTEGYRQRADLVMDMQQQVLNAEKRVKNSAEWEKDAYRQRDEWQARAEAAEAKLARVITTLFPEALQQSVETHGLFPDDLDDVPF